MDTRQLNFLNAVLGPDGSRALAKAAAQAPDLEWALFPRVVMAWLEVVSEGRYEAPLPGVEGTELALHKNEAGCSGSINIGSNVYQFSDASLFHVAGSVAVALGGAADEAPALRSPALAKLGKSIDLLVKSRTLRKMQAAHQGGAKGVKGPGLAAQQQQPLAPTPPTAVQPPPTGVAAGTPMGTANKPKKAPPKLPGVKPKKPIVKVTKSEAALKCLACGDPQFADGRYVGCVCFKSLAKGVRTIPTADGYTLEFGSAWDTDAIMALADNLGK